jgi:hypothetical protein
MRSDNCREWRVSLGAYALNQLPDDERAAVDSHLEGCPDCRAELESLSSVARTLPKADPTRIMGPAPTPPAGLGKQIEELIGAEQATATKKRRRRRFQFGFAGLATAAAAAALAIAILPGGGSGNDGSAPEQYISFNQKQMPEGVKIDAVLQPHAFGTEIHMYVTGVRSGTLCQVFLRGPDGRRYSAGSFRYRWGDDSDAVLSSALDLSRTRAIGVRAGDRTFVAPVSAEGATASIDDSDEEDLT